MSWDRRRRPSRGDTDGSRAARGTPTSATRQYGAAAIRSPAAGTRPAADTPNYPAPPPPPRRSRTALLHRDRRSSRSSSRQGSRSAWPRPLRSRAAARRPRSEPAPRPPPPRRSAADLLDRGTSTAPAAAPSQSPHTVVVPASAGPLHLLSNTDTARRTAQHRVEPVRKRGVRKPEDRLLHGRLEPTRTASGCSPRPDSDSPAFKTSVNLLGDAAMARRMTAGRQDGGRGGRVTRPARRRAALRKTRGRRQHELRVCDVGGRQHASAGSTSCRPCTTATC